MNVFWSDLITMVPKWNYLIFMQIDYPRWPTGTVSKNSRNTKTTISKDPLVEIDPTFSQNVSCMNPLFFYLFYFIYFFFAVWDSMMAAVTTNSAEHENDNISITAVWNLTKFVSE